MNNTKQQPNGSPVSFSIEDKASLHLHQKALRIHSGQYPEVGGVFTPITTIARELKRPVAELRLLIEGRGMRLHFGRYVCISRLRELLGLAGEKR